MGRYATIVFSDLERHSAAWSRAPRDTMVATLAEYRYLAESLAAQYGCLYLEWTGDGHMFIFENADAAGRFALDLIGRWRTRGAALAAEDRPRMPLRVGCHFGECTPMESGGWIGRGNSIAKRVEAEAGPDVLHVTETVLDLLDLPLYTFEEAGRRALKGDALPERMLYRLLEFDVARFAEKPPSELTAEDWFLKAVAFLGTEKEDSDEEAACYEQALRLRPDYAEAHVNYAVLLRHRGRPSEAARHYQEALRVRPDYPEAHSNYAALLAARGSRAGAIMHFREALRLRADFVDAHHGLANLLFQQGDAVGAARHYEEALRLRPEYAEAHSNYAILLERTGDATTATRHHREALRIKPDSPECHYNYALLLEDEGALEAAELRYREALRLWPDYAEAHNNLAALLHRRGELPDAESHYLQALRVRPDDPEAHYNYALLLSAVGDEENARRHLQTAAELRPEEPAFHSPMEAPGS